MQAKVCEDVSGATDVSGICSVVFGELLAVQPSTLTYRRRSGASPQDDGDVDFLLKIERAGGLRAGHGGPLAAAKDAPLETDFPITHTYEHAITGRFATVSHLAGRMVAVLSEVEAILAPDDGLG